MVNMTVGGRALDLTPEDVVHKMRHVQPEPIREHLVEMIGTVFPPKQVLAVVTGWDRQTFTTMEAQRVLNRLGFICRRAGRRPDGQPARVLAPSKQEPTLSIDRRLSTVESALAVAQEAIASMAGRVTKLESELLELTGSGRRSIHEV